MKRLLLLCLPIAVCASQLSAQPAFDLRLDHATVLVSDLDTSAAFYGGVLQLRELPTPWGAAAPVRFYALGGGRQLHVGVSDNRPQSEKNLHLAFAVADFDAYLRFLSERDIEYGDFRGRHHGIQTRPDGVRQVYLQDPDGNWIEINDVPPAPRVEQRP